MKQGVKAARHVDILNAVKRSLIFRKYKTRMFNFMRVLFMITMIFSDLYEVRSGETLWFARSMSEAVIILHQAAT